MKVQDKGSGQAQSIYSNVDAPRKNRFYTLLSRDEQESSPDVVTCMLQVFSINVYAILDLSATCLFLVPW